YVDLELGGVLADLMTGNGDGSVPPAEITELHESAINEAINQMIASGLTAISGELNKISFSTDIPQVKVVEINEGFSDEILEGDCAVAELKFSLMQYTDKPLYFVFKQDTVDSINEKYEPKTEAAAAKVAATAGAATQQESKEAQSKENQANSQKNMMLLLDVPLSVSVILGKSKMLMKDILNLGIGSIIELDKSASEPVDLAVNTKPIARGEVVVVDENFGLRITEIVSPLERLDIIKKEK
ncbi:MAG TPA: flagellar motor switch protein FliN, partial [bacterium]|nr:flagellar motor switch protein FliN [bacterium]